MKVNMVAAVLIVVSVAVMAMGITGSYRYIWTALTGKDPLNAGTVDPGSGGPLGKKKGSS